MLHAKTMVGVVAYDMYIEYCEVDFNLLWKVKKPLMFWKFCDRLGQQMLSYDPRFCHYPGDDKMRPYTAMNQEQRTKKASSSVSASHEEPPTKRKKSTSNSRSR